MTQTELNTILAKHALWASGDPQGTRANLSRADLYGANLSRANLSRADLYGANLSRANLSGANLSGANLSEANLYWANLSEANLYGANLSGANLSGAYLSGANLSGADLSEANLYWANLSEAKGVVVFSAGRHTAVYYNKVLKIGCREMTPSQWLKSFRRIGEFQGYTSEQVKHYGLFIKLCVALRKGKK